MFVVNGQECDAILIELKGVDIVHSLKQIDGTLIQFKGFFSQFKHVYGRVVVISSVPNIKANPAYVKLEKKIRTVYKGNIKISKVQFNEKRYGVGTNQEIVFGIKNNILLIQGRSKWKSTKKRQYHALMTGRY